MMTKNTSLNLQYLETMSGGDRNTMKTLMETLLNELNSNKTTAWRLYQQQRWSDLDRFCHHFKSTLAFSGNSKLINANLQLWDLAKNSGGKPTDGKKIIADLERQCQLVARELSQVLKTI